jgi:predicted esterase
VLRTPESLQSHSIVVKRTARYYTLGPTDGSATRVWIVCHGYSQLAGQFIRYFETLDDGETLIVAPEGLSLCYLNRWAAEKGEARKVGATWMTRENRLAEIENYIAYLDDLYDELFEITRRDEVHLTAFGFSQGAATVSRWVAHSNRYVDRIVLWGGGIPPDLDLSAVSTGFHRAALRFVIGRSDEIVPRSAVEEQEKKLRHHGIPYRLTRFDGGHHLSQKILKQVADEDEPD